ncbi:uncharacterized protein FFMR_15831 [Fusarium fujikuroi]|nr:uncharacterized protein FFMR_15831 [Fusarium fujikuroi]
MQEVRGLPPATDRETRRENDEFEEKAKHVCFTVIAAIKIIDDSAPKSWREARKRHNYEQWWKKAEEKQIQSLHEKEAWILVECPEGVQVLDGKWVYDVKYPQGEDPYPRARWVVRGDQEKGEYETGDLYAAVAHTASVRVFLTIVAILGKSIWFSRMDMKMVPGEFACCKRLSTDCQHHQFGGFNWQQSC